MPPMLIFPRVRVNEEYLQGKPEGSWTVFRKSGWMETDIFTEWFKKFIDFSRASVDNLVLLLLDDHHSHDKNLEVAELGKANSVTILCSPPHCTHRMQPLDVAFMKPLSTYYTEEINHFQRGGTRVQMKDIFSIFGRAWQKAAKIETAVNAFHKTEITPLNVNIFDSYFQKPNEDVCSSPGTSNDIESTATIKAYKDVIDNIMVSNNTLPTSSASSTSNSSHAVCENEVQNVESNSTSRVPLVSNPGLVGDISPNSSEPAVTIPLSYIMNAKPLLSLLNSALGQQVLGTSDGRNKLVQSNDLQLKPSNGIFESTKPKVNRKRGSSAIVTSDEHIEELSVQKIKKIKKESVDKKRAKPRVKSDVILNNPAIKPKKAVKKKTEVTKRQPLTELNHQIIQNNVVDLDSIPLDSNTIFLQTGDGNLQPLFAEPISMEDLEMPLMFMSY